MLVGTKEVSLSFFLFCCSASSLALASSVEMMFFIFALEEKQKKKYSVIVRKGSRHRSAKWMDLEASNSTAVPSDVVFERGGSATETDTLFQRQNGSSHLCASLQCRAQRGPAESCWGQVTEVKSLFPEVMGWS